MQSKAQFKTKPERRQKITFIKESVQLQQITAFSWFNLPEPPYFTIHWAMGGKNYWEALSYLIQSFQSKPKPKQYRPDSDVPSFAPEGCFAQLRAVPGSCAPDHISCFTALLCLPWLFY